MLIKVTIHMDFVFIMFEKFLLAVFYKNKSLKIQSNLNISFPWPKVLCFFWWSTQYIPAWGWSIKTPGKWQFICFFQ